MKHKSILDSFRQMENKLNISIFIIGSILLSISVYIQIENKNRSTNRTLELIAKTLRNDLLEGNQLAVYQLCNAFIASAEFDQITVKRGDELYCDSVKAEHHLSSKKDNIFSTYTQKLQAKKMVNIFYTTTPMPNQKAVGTVLASFSYLNIISEAFFLVIVFLFFIMILFFWQKRQKKEIANNLLHPILNFKELIINNPRDLLKIQSLKNDFQTEELVSLVDNYEMMTKLITQQEKELVAFTKDKTAIEIAKLVAHDIRSPLESLNSIISSELSIHPENKDLMIQSINRINNISNTLLSRAKNKTMNNSEVISIIRMLIQEKEKTSKVHIQLNTSLNTALAYANENELARILSNILTNSLEAIYNQESGFVKINVDDDGDFWMIVISDNGSGIRPEDLDKIGSKGLSFGEKVQTGNGLGLYSAINYLKSVGGLFSIQSVYGSGTTIKLKILKQENAAIHARNFQHVLIDNDKLIHKLWEKYFKKFDLQLNLYSDLETLKSDINRYAPLTRFYIDYDLDDCTGADVINYLSKLGFKELYLASGYEQTDFSHLDVKQVIGKKPHFF